MTSRYLPASFEPGSAVTGSHGQRVHPEQIEQTARLGPRTYALGNHAWCVVGNGLSNQTFIEGPDGLIAIDTGECVEEMQSALREVRRFTSAPIVACIYSHFHYVGGTSALLAETGGADLPIYGHADIAANLRRFGGEAAPRYTRGLVHQFGLLLPKDGPDSLENVGLGLHFRNPDHAPYTPGYVPATVTFERELEVRIAGLRVLMTHAPSDADDSISIWFPDLNLAVNNLVWPALFNVFAIRGEEYRDPRVVLRGLDELATLPCDHLIGTHGPPLSGAEQISEALTDYRDAIQFLWDQTVRGANKGLNLDELVEFVQLPERFNRSFYTRQLYGLAEHHVRQIYQGLFGWFDEDAARLFTPPPREMAQRLVAGFGGPDPVRAQVDAALEQADYRWALQLASWLVRAAPDGEAADRERLGAALRGIAHNTPSANVRNWCLTKALELAGTLDLDRYRGHRLRAHEVIAGGPEASVAILRVLLEPRRSEGINDTLIWKFADGSRAGITIRDGVAVPGDRPDAELAIHLSLETWATVLSGKLTLDDALAGGSIRLEGDEQRIRQLLGAFDVAALRAP